MTHQTHIVHLDRPGPYTALCGTRLEAKASSVTLAWRDRATCPDCWLIAITNTPPVTPGTRPG